MPPSHVTNLGTRGEALHNNLSLRLIRPGSPTRRPLKNLQSIYTTDLIKQMVWLCWKTLHLTILLNMDR